MMLMLRLVTWPGRKDINIQWPMEKSDTTETMKNQNQRKRNIFLKTQTSHQGGC